MTPSRVLVALALLCSACFAEPTTAPSASFRTVGVGGGFVSAAAGTRIITDAGAWKAFLTQADVRGASGDPADPVPEVSFASEHVVAIWAGQRPTSGYRLSVDRVERRGSTLRVYAVEEQPCVGATVITYPLVVIAVPKTVTRADVSWTVVPCR